MTNPAFGCTSAIDRTPLHGGTWYLPKFCCRNVSKHGGALVLPVKLTSLHWHIPRATEDRALANLNGEAVLTGVRSRPFEPKC